MTPRKRRQSDRPIWNWLTVLGAVLVLAAVGLKAFDRLEGSDFWATLAAGLFLVRPDKMVDIVRARWGARAEDHLTTEPKKDGDG